MKPRYGIPIVALLLASCSIAYDQHQIAVIHAVGVTGPGASLDVSYREIESTLDGVTSILRKAGFQWTTEDWTHSHGKRYDYGYYLTGERVYNMGFLYSAVEHPYVQCIVEINRKNATLRFFESEWPFGSHGFPLSEPVRQHVRDTARVTGDYLRRHLPSHDVQVSIDFGPPHVTKA